ncbi:MAG TPA: hypothetical protein VL485_31375 [Ktedonobacteraceae bacterium]|nr:hypothetical protein [Ktedonobacteraceae bacterium]
MKKLRIQESGKKRYKSAPYLFYLFILPTITPVSQINTTGMSDSSDPGTIILWCITVLILLGGCAGMILLHRHLHK